MSVVLECGPWASSTKITWGLGANAEYSEVPYSPAESVSHLTSSPGDSH